MYLFIKYCNSDRLIDLIDERIAFCPLREGVRGQELSTVLAQRLDENAKLLEDEASSIFSSRKAENRLEAEDEDVIIFQNKSEQKLVASLWSRACRLRMYIAAIIKLSSSTKRSNKLAYRSGMFQPQNNPNSFKGFALISKISKKKLSEKNEQEKEIYHDRQATRRKVDWTRNAESMIEEDFACAREIKLDNIIDTIEKQMEYLLNRACEHLTDAAMTGWEMRNGLFEKFVETILNKFIIELTGLMSNLFEDKGIIRSLKVFELENNVIM